jgi:hypothetical protein
MADSEERLAKAQEHVDLAEGYMTDAEFREEYETRFLRYLQATCNALLALYLQNQTIIELMSKQQDSLHGRR